MKKLNAKITATGIALPRCVQTNEELAPIIGRSEKWIASRTGVKQRFISDEPMDVLGARAARAAIADGPKPDLIINASLSTLQLIPDSAVFLQQQLGYSEIPCFSIHATCLSFLVALKTAASFILAESYRRILIISSETCTAYRNLDEPESASLFGDGAAAVIVEATPENEPSAVLAWKMATWHDGASLTEFRGCGTRNPPASPHTRPEDNLFHMDGPKAFKMALRRVVPALDGFLSENGLSIDEIDHVVPHQTSGPGLAAFESYFKHSKKVVNIVEDHGNCIAASIPMALAIAQQRNPFKRGDLVLLGGTGAGFSVSFLLIRW